MLIDYTMAAQHLKLYELASDPEIQADVERKMAQADAIVMTHLKTHLWETPPTWDETTDPETDFQYALAQSAVLLVLSNLWRFRGDDEQASSAGGPMPASAGPLSPRVAELLAQIRDPSFA
jgi:hypothetical protein